MRKNTKVILASLSIIASTTVLAPLASPVAAADTTAVATSTNAKADTQSITLAITKTGTSDPSEAANFLGKTATVTLKDGKVTEITIHVDGANSPMSKGQDMTKLLSAMTLNGVTGKQENIAKDNSSFDFVFPASAYKEGKGTVSFTLNVMGKTMTESADATLGAITGATSADTQKSGAKTTKKAKKTTKSKKVKRTLKHNAYIYKKNGKRANKKVLKKGKKVNIYRKAIKLHGKQFYKIAKNQYVKKANF